MVFHTNGVLLDFEELVQTCAKVSLHAVKGEDLRGGVSRLRYLDFLHVSVFILDYLRGCL